MIFRMAAALLLLFNISFQFSVAFADEIQIKVGPEFTFSRADLRAVRWGMPNGDAQSIRPENYKALTEYRQLIFERCAPHRCTVEQQFKTLSSGEMSPEVKVTYPDGWWFMATLDPAVIEFQAKEMTAHQLLNEGYASRIQQDIFDVCAELNLVPTPGIGGGHIHIDLNTAFAKDGWLLRNFIVDFYNHSGLTAGPLTIDRGNATALAYLRDDQKNAFRTVISDFDERRIVGRLNLAKAIENRVYYWHPRKPFNTKKYMALNLTRVTDSDLFETERTVEIRALRAQRTVEDFILLVRLFEARLNLLQSNRSIPTINELNILEDSNEIVRQFENYVEESGLKFEEYAKLLPATLQPTCLSILKTRTND